jgi:anti-sigma B factor antagonist
METALPTARAEARRPEKFQVSVESSFDRTLVVLRGALDLGEQERFRETLARIERDELVVIDLRGLTFIDSIGLRTIVEYCGGADKDGSRVEVVCGEGQVGSLIELSGLDAILPMSGAA